MRTKVMHFVKRLFVALIAFIVVFGCIPAQRVEAKDYYSYESVPLESNKWITTREFTQQYKNNNIYHKYYAYKITVPANGYLKVDVKFQEENNEVDILSSIKKNTYDYYTDLYSSDSKNKTFYVVMSKGTYYFVNRLPCKIRWKFIQSKNPTNSCRAKSKKIASNKKEMVVFNHGYEFSRWYKVVLKKRQPITVNLRCLDGDSSTEDFDVYKSTGESVNCPPLVDYKTYRTTILPKGTYYINIKHDPWGLDKRIMNFSWK